MLSWSPGPGLYKTGQIPFAKINCIAKKSINMQCIQEFLSNSFDPIDFQIRKSTFQIKHFKYIN